MSGMSPSAEEYYKDKMRETFVEICRCLDRKTKKITIGRVELFMCDTCKKPICTSEVK